MQDQPEQGWIEKAQNGDADAFEQLVRAHEKQVYLLAFRFTNQPEDAFDIAQETFLRAWRSLPGFRNESSFSTWLYRLASNQCIDFARKNNRGRRWETSLEAPDDEGQWKPLDIPDTRFDPVTAAEKAEFARTLSEALTKLHPEHRVIFLLRESGGLSYADIAQTLELEEGTVKSRLSRAREALRGMLADWNHSQKTSSKSKEQR